MPLTKAEQARADRDQAQTEQDRLARERHTDEAPQTDETETEDVQPAPFGSATDPYGRTNHALSEDEVNALAAEAGNLRSDGKARGVYFEDVLAERQERQRQWVEAQQHDNPPAFPRLPGETQVDYETRLRAANTLPPRPEAPGPGESQVAFDARMKVHDMNVARYESMRENAPDKKKGPEWDEQREGESDAEYNKRVIARDKAEKAEKDAQAEKDAKAEKDK